MDIEKLFAKIFDKFSYTEISDIILTENNIYILHNQDLQRVTLFSYSFIETIRGIFENSTIYKKYGLTAFDENELKAKIAKTSSINATFAIKLKNLRFRIHIFLSRGRIICILRLIHFADKDFRTTLN